MVREIWSVNISPWEHIDMGTHQCVPLYMTKGIHWSSLLALISSSSHHLSLNHEGRWGTINDFATSFLHFPLFSTALCDLVNSRPVHSLICLPTSSFVCLDEGGDHWIQVCVFITLMVRGANFPPIIAWKVSNTLRSFSFLRSNLSLVCFGMLILFEKKRHWRRKGHCMLCMELYSPSLFLVS